MTEAIQDNGAYLYNGYELASIKSRFWAAIIDSVFLWIVMRVIFPYFPQYDLRGYALYFYFCIVSIFVEFIINYSFLRNGQTIGMKFFDIQITDLRRNIASIWRLFFLWHVIPGILFILIEIVGLSLFYYYYELNNLVRVLCQSIIFIDLAFIFRQDRRTLHDHFAGTIVIKLSRKAHNANPSNMEGKTNEIFI